MVRVDVHPGRTPRQLGGARGAFFVAAELGLVRGQVRQCAAQAFVADDLLHAENLWRDFVAA
jgi:hypothetical protein